VIPPVKQEAARAGAGIVQVSIGGVGARTMLPATAGLYYALDFRQGGATVKTAAIASGGAASVELAAGTYSLAVKGYVSEAAYTANAGAYVVAGSVASIAVSEGGITPVAVSLSPKTETGAGFLHYEYTFPWPTVDPAEATLEIATLDGTVLHTIDLTGSAGGNAYARPKAEGTVGLPAGYYAVTAYAERDTAAFSEGYATLYDIAHVYDQLTTSTGHAFVTADFAAARPWRLEDDYTVGGAAGGPGLYVGAVSGASVPAITAKAEVANPLATYLEYIRQNAADNETYTMRLDRSFSSGPVDLDEMMTGGHQVLQPNGVSYIIEGAKTGVNFVLEGHGAERTIQLSGAGALFIVESGFTLTLGNNITLAGVANNTDPVVAVAGRPKGGIGVAYYTNFGGTLAMLAGSKITGNTNTHSDSSGDPRIDAGGVGIKGGNFTMSGGEISGNAITGDGSGVGGVLVSVGTFTMGGSAAITGNTATRGPVMYTDIHNVPYVYVPGTAVGGVLVGASGVFEMQGSASVSGNTGAGTQVSVGGVYIVSNAGIDAPTFAKTGGAVSGNVANGAAADKGNAVFWAANNRRINGDLTGNLSVSGGAATPNYLWDFASVSVNVGGDTTVEQGDTNKQYTATVLGDGTVTMGDNGITWEVARQDGNALKTGTAIGASDGKLDVGADEPAGTLLVTATAAAPISLSSAAYEVTVQAAGGGITGEGVYMGTTLLSDLSTVSGTTFLDKALAYIKADTAYGDNDNYVIAVGAGFTQGPVTLNSTTIGTKRNITLRGLSAASVITLTGNGRLVTIDNGQTLTLGQYITLQGHTSNNAPLVCVGYSGEAHLVMEADAAPGTGPKITGNSENGWGAGGVYVYGTFAMHGGTISDNRTTADGGGGVYVYGTFAMDGGEISGNTATRGAGGVKVDESSTFTMSAGTITGNTMEGANGGAGGVYIANGCTFTKTGGTISGNTATNTGVVWNPTGSDRMPDNRRFGDQVFYFNSTDNKKVTVSLSGSLSTNDTALNWESIPSVSAMTAVAGPNSVAKGSTGNQYTSAMTVLHPELISPAPHVIWVISHPLGGNNTLAAGTVISADGVLTVDASETASQIRVMVFSSYPGASGTMKNVVVSAAP
jgi:hypothetical protein